MNKIKTVVIDDEFFNRGLITLLINRINQNFSIEGEAENIRDGLKLIDKIKPEVVFLDIKMPGGSGFDLLKQATDYKFELVFVTGFDNYESRAIELNALDYVLKPIDIDKFKITLDKVQSTIENNRLKML